MPPDSTMRALLGNPDSTHPKSALGSGGFAGGRERDWADWQDQESIAPTQRLDEAGPEVKRIRHGAWPLPSRS
jgi:hypothetical protein